MNFGRELFKQANKEQAQQAQDRLDELLVVVPGCSLLGLFKMFSAEDFIDRAPSVVVKAASERPCLHSQKKQGDGKRGGGW